MHQSCQHKNGEESVKKYFPGAIIKIETDVDGAAKALCGGEKGIACILGTGSSSCYYNGKRIAKIIPGSGAISRERRKRRLPLDKRIQYYLYNTFDEDLRSRFDAKFVTNTNEILNAVYKQPLANRYLASFAIFLAENRGHYMIENIIEDGFNDFFYNHIYKFSESWKYPVHFTGGIAYGFKDVLAEMCDSYQLQLGNVLRNPMEGLIKYHGE